MRKLKLDVDGLAVESFATAKAAIESAGTVRGFATTTQPAEDTQESCDTMCGGNRTIYITCELTCYTCQGESGMCLTQYAC
jgi:hypothetical protein